MISKLERKGFLSHTFQHSTILKKSDNSFSSMGNKIGAKL
jgi:hypothetical protein